MSTAVNNGSTVAVFIFAMCISAKELAEICLHSIVT
jgi:hypothetical protein